MARGFVRRLSHGGRPVDPLLSRLALFSAASRMREQLGNLPHVYGRQALSDPATHIAVLRGATHYARVGGTERCRAQTLRRLKRSEGFPRTRAGDRLCAAAP